MWFLIAINLLLISTSLSCPNHCTCSDKEGVINCANGEFSHIPQGVSTDVKYHHLNLAHNYIEDLTLKDILVLDTFRNQLVFIVFICNSTNLYLYNRGYILSDCHFLTFTSTSKSILLGNSTSKYETTSHIKNKTPSTYQQTGKSSSKWLLLILVPGLVAFVTCALLLTRKLHSKHRVIQARAMELNVLRSCDESDEEDITLFNSKEKQF